MKHQRIIIIAISLGILLGLAACGQNQGGLDVVNTNDSSLAENNDTVQQQDSVPPQEPAAEQQGSQFWVENQDPVLGFRFAMPCFWRLEISEDLETQAGDLTEYSYSFFNYPADYPNLFEDGIIPVDNNAFEVVLKVVHLASEKLSSGMSLTEYLNQEYNQAISDGTITELFIEETVLNDNEAALVFVNENPYSYKYYLLRINPDYLLEIKAKPSSKLFDTLDLQGILKSITVDSQAVVPMPEHVPGDFPTSPAAGVGASCIQGPLGNDITP